MRIFGPHKRGMGFRTGLLATLILASGCGSTLVLDDDGALIVIPHETGSQGHIIVEAMINDQGPFRFALDTGASISVIFDQTREKAGLDLVTGKRVIVAGMVGIGDFPISSIANFKVGSESWTNARVASLPALDDVPLEIDGILGIDFLSRYAVGVSPGDQVVRLYPPTLVSERSYWGWASIPMRQLQIGRGNATAYTINLHINKITIPALLDLGAGANLMNWHAARAIRVRPTKPASKNRIFGAVGVVPIIAQLDVRELMIENIRWRRQTFLISDFSIFEVLGLVNKSFAIVGPGLFKERDFVIDFERNRMLLSSSK